MKLKLDDCFIQVGNKIFWIGEIKYLNREYETLYDSKGNGHYVQVSYEEKSAVINESNYKLKNIVDNGYYQLCIDDREFDCANGSFQMYLERYEIYYPDYKFSSMYNLIYGIISDNNKKRVPVIRHYLLDDYKYYFPLYETCFTSGNNTELERGISDKVFFNFEDKKRQLRM